MSFAMFTTSIRETLAASFSADLARNIKFQTLLDVFPEIKFNASCRQESINKFISDVKRISDHITSFMYRITNTTHEDYVLAAACGSGAFLVKAMCNTINYVGASAFNNGITGRIGNRESINPAGTISELMCKHAEREHGVSIRRNAYCSGERSSLLLQKIEIL